MINYEHDWFSVYTSILYSYICNIIKGDGKNLTFVSKLSYIFSNILRIDSEWNFYYYEIRFRLVPTCFDLISTCFDFISIYFDLFFHSFRLDFDLFWLDFDLFWLDFDLFWLDFDLFWLDFDLFWFVSTLFQVLSWEYFFIIENHSNNTLNSIFSKFYFRSKDSFIYSLLHI